VDVIPAIDVLDGRVVRLLRGSYEAVTVYDEDPVAVGRRWREEGAALLHVVDLGAARGDPPDRALWAGLAAAELPFQIGGGIRGGATAQAAVAAGARQVVVGSAVVAGAVAEVVDAVGPGRVVAALDVRGGRAHGSGWRDAGVPLEEAAATLRRAGVRRALVTGIERDGALTGPDLALLGHVATTAPFLTLIASGGVATLADLRSLSGLRAVEGAIVGRALYEGAFTLGEALRTVEAPPVRPVRSVPPVPPPDPPR